MNQSWVVMQYSDWWTLLNDVMKTVDTSYKQSQEIGGASNLQSLDEAEALSQKVKYFYDIFYSFLCD